MSRARSELRRRTQTSSWFSAAGLSDPGRQREVNEDRSHIDLARGIFIVVDGVGGQAAGGKAADVALALLRERLERETGPVVDRVREAITIANNEIHRLAGTRPEWEGMACVLTVAVLDEDKATIGHVGDTRLYKIGTRGLQKITRDHSPVGEREDAGEITELEAMRHPRRNEVYRDVGSEPHDTLDPEFVDIHEIAFEPEAALLLCSDGLTDLVDSTSILAAIDRFAGDPQAVVTALIAAANDAGGKDNVTVVYVEGDRFERERPFGWATGSTSLSSLEGPAGFNRGSADITPDAIEPDEGNRTAEPSRTSRRWVRVGILLLSGILLIIAGFLFGQRFEDLRASRWLAWLPTLQSVTIGPRSAPTQTHIVRPAESIAAAINRAGPGSQVLVEPGEYREQLRLKDGVRVVSRVPRGASIRLPVNAQEGMAVVAHGLSQAEFVGFKIVGDAATPLGVGVFADDSALSIVDVEISGATRAGIEFAGARPAALLASTIHDNPGAAVIVNRGATPRIAHNAFRRNGVSEHATGMLLVNAGAAPIFHKNVFIGLTADAFAALEQATRLSLSPENWFIAPATPPTSGPRTGSSRPSPAASSRPAQRDR